MEQSLKTTENVAQYLVDMHDSKGTFDFCGGMMFQLVLTDKLRSHLASVATNGGAAPVVHDAKLMRMAALPVSLLGGAPMLGSRHAMIAILPYRRPRQRH